MTADRRALIILALAILPCEVADAQVRFERTGYRLTSIGEKISVSARSAGGQQTSGIRFRVADPSIATVTPQGVVESRRAGFTRLWAVAGNDSASALILVDQWAARFDFFPAIVRLEAVGATMLLRIQARDAAGFVIADPDRRIGACRSLDERIAVLASNGEVSARANGVTYVRCTDRGIADSVRVEVRQRAARVTIADKLGFGNRVVRDTFQIRISAVDPAGDEIRDPRATWASMSPVIVSIDPLSGMARAVSPGAAKIVAQVGDATDTVTVQVLPGMGIAPIASADTSADLGALAEVRAPSLHLQPLFLTVGDTARVIPRDATGAAIANAEFRVMSSDTSVVRPISGQRVVARRTGSTHVAAEFGGIRDSALVSIRERADPGAIAAAGAAAAVVFVRPTFNLDSAQRHNRAQLDSAARAIQRQSVVAVHTGRMASIAAVAMHAAHSTRDTNFLERRTGVLFGAEVELAPHRYIKLTGSLRTGRLSPSGASGEDLTVTEVEGDLTLQPAPWFGLRGGYVVRTTTTDIATQRWAFPRASAVARFAFVGGAITTTTGISVLPGATYTGYLDAQGDAINPALSVAGEAGIELHTGSFTAALLYYAERFAFPKVNNSTDGRTDQFSALRLKLGFQLGR